MISKKIVLILVLFVYLWVSLLEDILAIFVQSGVARLHKRLNKMCNQPQYKGTISKLYYSMVHSIHMCRDEYIEEVRRLDFIAVRKCENIGGK